MRKSLLPKWAKVKCNYEKDYFAAEISASAATLGMNSKALQENGIKQCNFESQRKNEEINTENKITGTDPVST